MNSTQKTLYRIVTSLFELGDGEISSELQIGDVPLWDSLGHAKLMLAVEDEFEIALSADEVADAQSVGELEALIHRKMNINGTN